MKNQTLKKQISVEIVSDVVCPWCYIGKRRLDEAIQNLKDDFDFKVEFKPFQLDPGLPANGTEFQAHLQKKFGNGARLQEAFSNVTAIGKQLGIEFNFDKIPKAINTFLLHVLLQEAKREGKEKEVAMVLFDAYFTKGMDLSDFSQIAKLMLAFDWDENKTRKVLENTEMQEEVKEEMKQLRMLGISGVPFFIINQKYAVSGAQQSETFIRAFQSLKPEDFPAEQDTICEVGGQNC